MSDEALFLRGRKALDAGQFEEARRLFDAHELALGTTDETRALLATAERKTAAGDVNGAARDLQRVVERNPALAQAWVGLGRLALFTGDAASAKVHATAATRLEPGLGAGWTLLGLVHEASNDLPAALEALRRGATAAPEAFFSQYNLGRALAAARRVDEALPLLKRAVELEPKNPSAYETLAHVLSRAGHLDQAVEVLERLTTLTPGATEAWASLVDLHFARKAVIDARAAADRGLAAAGDNPILLEKALACAMLLDDVDGAVAYLERELKVAPQHDRAWLNLANLSILTGDVARAELVARALLGKNPTKWEAHFVLGNLFEATGRLDEAIAAYRSAVAHGPHEWRPHVNLGAALVQHASAERNSEAVEVLSRALRLVPSGEWRAHYNLALARARLGARDEALALVRRIEAEGPPGAPIVVEANRLRRNLGG
ncbi:MAG: tetratricopeptide repeat protein [Myxococcaceae bacterium]|nr:tetratricopeptide repeat protein [Myxococcaceae bacterium]